MTNKPSIALLLLTILLLTEVVWGEERSLPQPWDYTAAMKKAVGKFRGRPGVVLHVGDSITYANPYGQWPRGGEGKTEADKAILQWMHTGADNDTDGWWLARFDHPDGGRSYTACGGIRADEMLAGGKQHMPPFVKLLDTYRPQMVVLMLGTNDASARRSVEAYQADMAKAVDLMLERGIIPILSTIPPHVGQPDKAKSYNEALRKLAKKHAIPLLDYEKEILKRRPDDWNGTLLGKNDVHPTVGVNDTKTTSVPTAENLRNSGYLLRGWLSVEKIAEVKRRVLDDSPAPTPKVRKPTGEAVRAPVTRDTWFSNVGAEADGNKGGSTRLKLKSNQEMSLIDIDPKPLRGRVVQGATLHVHLAGKERLHRVTVGSFGADWVEGTSPWLLDEPSNFQDYRALRYFGTAFHEGRNQAPGEAKMVFRCDISRPQWQRDALDGLLDYNVVGGAMRSYRRLVFDRKAANGEIVVEYAGSNAIEEANMQPVGWSLDSWSLGSDGVLPWQTVGNGDSWRRAEPLALFYPGRNAREREPIPSIRLKAYCRGQQDVEYLTLLTLIKGEPRWALGRRVREALKLAGERKGTGFAGEDAGVIHFAQLKPQDVWALRVRVGQVLSDAAPASKRRLIELRTPPRHPEKLSPGYVSVGEVPSRESVP